MSAAELIGEMTEAVTAAILAVPYLSRTEADCFKLCGSAYASLPTLFRLLHTRECSRAANQAIQAHLIELLIARY